MPDFSSNKLVNLFFFGNYFYGICAIALSVESTLQQHYPLNTIWYYILTFSCTVVYYTNAYLLTEVSDDIANVRSVWYTRNKKLMLGNQLVFLIILLICAGYFLITYRNIVPFLNGLEWFLLLVFPLTSAFYYGTGNVLSQKINLRNIGWLKPFIIGFTWAGLVTIYPVLFYCVTRQIHYTATYVAAFLFLKNFMFISLLCILFDIKDYAMDYNAQIKTLVVKLGLRKTIFYVIIPLCLIGLGFFLTYAILQHFKIQKILINTLPFLLTLAVAYSMHNRRSIFYYLIIIDGLMLVKAVCGITAMLLF